LQKHFILVWGRQVAIDDRAFFVAAQQAWNRLIELKLMQITNIFCCYHGLKKTLSVGGVAQW